MQPKWRRDSSERTAFAIATTKKAISRRVSTKETLFFLNTIRKRQLS